MFLGEMLCFFAYEVLYRLSKRKSSQYEEIDGNQNDSNQGGFKIEKLIAGNRNFNPFIFLPASCCDMLGTSLAYIGLNLTYASSFQMLTGAIMIFTGILSVIFLKTKMPKYRWLGILVVVCGLVVIGVCDLYYSNGSASIDKKKVILGDLLIIISLVISSIQMVYEEKFISKHEIPALKAVGWEGIFGFFILGLLLIPMYFIKVPAFSKDDPDNRLENALGAFYQMGQNPTILWATIVNTISIAFVNFSGISITKEISATTRVVLGNLRTLAVYVITISIGWQKFHGLQLLGLALLIIGIMVYNNILFGKLYEKVFPKKTTYDEIGNNSGISNDNYLPVNRSSDD